MLNKIVFAAVLIGFCMSLNGALYLIWMEVVIELPEYSSRLMLAYYVVSVFGLWVWRKLGIKTSKHYAAGIACLYAIVVLLIGFIGYWFIKDFEDFPKLIGVGSFIILYGFAFSGPLPLINAITADISDKLNPILISSISYENVRYTHQGWFTEDYKYFIVGDELDELSYGGNTRTLIFNLTDLDNPSLSFEYFGTTPAIDHNGYTVGDSYFLANYRAGMREIDISQIESKLMTEVGYFDTYPENDNPNFTGAWSVYPYFESENIVISDIWNGLFVVKRSN